MRSVPFMVQSGIPRDYSEGDIIEIDGEKHKITKIKRFRFIDMRTFQVIGLCRKID